MQSCLLLKDYKRPEQNSYRVQRVNSTPLYYMVGIKFSPILFAGTREGLQNNLDIQIAMQNICILATMKRGKRATSQSSVGTDWTHQMLSKTVSLRFLQDRRQINTN
jgi:hypothetical protein